MNLQEFLEYKTMYYDKIDYTIIKKSWDILAKEVTLPYVIHIVGTNGKGSTGRFLAHYLNKSDFDVLHYSSPHINNFNERIWINGEDISDEDLEKLHIKLQEILPKEYLEKLTYFEYTTLLALLSSSNKDYIVLEAGLGGEFDATNVVKNNLSLITAIGLDHQAFLGNTIKEIASTKLRSCDNKMILLEQKDEVVYEVAKEYDYFLSKEFDTSLLKEKFPSYLHKNLCLALSALDYLNIEINLEKFLDLELFGRCQRISKNITIDVGHNPLAASVIKDEFADKCINLIYNSYKDKDFTKVLEILKPIIDTLYILNVDDYRVIEKEKLVEACNKNSIKFKDFESVDENKEYLVFGSFSVVEEFLKRVNEK